MSDQSKWFSWLFDIIEKIRDWLERQEWYQEGQEKWQTLDTHSKNIIKLCSGATGMVLIAWIVIQTIWSVYDTKSLLEKKMDILNMIQSANSELSVLKGDSRSASTPGTQTNWDTYFSEKASRAGIDATRLSVENGSITSNDKKNLADESIFKIKMRQVNIKQLVRFSFFLESGAEPVKVRTLSIETEGLDGYLNATILVSSFQIKDKES